MFALQGQTLNELLDLKAPYSWLNNLDPADRTRLEASVAVFASNVTILALKYATSSLDFQANWTLQVFSQLISYLFCRSRTHLVKEHELQS
jgi:hypothetical protein